MSDPTDLPACFLLGEWTVDSALGRVSRGLEARRVRPLVMGLLRLLAASPGQVVSKDQIIAGAWGGAAVADSVVTSTIAELRQLLDDNAQHPTYIQTIPKRGYRLVASIEIPAVDGAPAPAAAGFLPTPDPDPSRRPVVAAAQAVSATSPASRSALWLVGFMVGSAAAVGLMVSVAMRRHAVAASDPPAEVRLTVALPNGLRLGTGNTPRLAVSPDGRWLAYVARDSAQTTLHLRRLGTFESRAVPRSEGATSPFFSPDGEQVAFFAGGELRATPVSGGATATLCEVRVANGGVWRRNGTIIFGGSHGQGLREVAASGGEPVTRTTLDAASGERGHRWPDLTPDGRTIVFTSVRPAGHDIVALDLVSGERRLLLAGAAYARWSGPDRLLYLQQGKLFVRGFEPAALSLIGPATMVADDVMVSPDNAVADFAVSRTGPLIYVPADPQDLEGELVWVDRAGNVRPVGAPRRPFMHPRLSPDGTQILTWIRADDEDLWLYDLRKSGLQRLVTGLAGHRADWSPDGTRVAFDAPRDRQPLQVFLAPLPGGRATHLPMPDATTYYSSSWSPDATRIALVNVTSASGFDIVVRTLHDAGTTTRVLATRHNEMAPAFSPDGRWLAFVSNRTGRDEIFITRYPPEGAPIRVSTEGGREPVWGRSGVELFYRRGDEMVMVEVALGSAVRVSPPRTMFTGRFDERPSWRPNYDVGRDGRFLMVRAATDPRSGSQIAVVMHWQARLTPPAVP